MIKLKQAVIVEGKYDKIKLKNILDAVIITTDGFRIFKDKEKTELIKSFAEDSGIVILTDSDFAGFKIRNYLKGCIKNGKITNVYIPEIFGKEKRKEKPSSAGLLGVEGVDDNILKESLSAAGIIGEECFERSPFLDRVRLMDDGLIGSDNAAEKRKRLLSHLNLPTLLSTSSMLEIINCLFTEEDYINALNKIKEK